MKSESKNHLNKKLTKKIESNRSNGNIPSLNQENKNINSSKNLTKIKNLDVNDKEKKTIKKNINENNKTEKLNELLNEEEIKKKSETDIEKNRVLLTEINNKNSERKLFKINKNLKDKNIQILKDKKKKEKK